MNQKAFNLIFFIFFTGLINCQTNNSSNLHTDNHKNTIKTFSFIEIDGKKIHYRSEGEGPIIILLPGMGADLRMWNYYTDFFKKNYKVISIDLPGFKGQSERFFHKRNHSFENQAIFLNKFAIALSLEKFHIMGSSWGGGIAWKFSIDNPEKVKSLILISSGGAKSPILTNINIPSLILWGKKDRLLPLEHAYLIKGKISNSKLIMYENGGHVPILSLRKKTIKDVNNFLIKHEK